MLLAFFLPMVVSGNISEREVEANNQMNGRLIEYRESLNGENLMLEYTIATTSADWLISPCLDSDINKEIKVDLRLPSININMDRADTDNFEILKEKAVREVQSLAIMSSIFSVTPYYYDILSECGTISYIEIDEIWDELTDEQYSFIEDNGVARWQYYWSKQSGEKVVDITPFLVSVDLLVQEHSRLVSEFDLSVCPLWSDAYCQCPTKEKSIDGICINNIIINESQWEEAITQLVLTEQEVTILQALVSQLNDIINNMETEKQESARVQVLTVFQKLPAISQRKDIDIQWWSDYLISIR